MVFDNKKEIAEMFSKIPLSRDSAIRRTEICARSVRENILADLTKRSKENTVFLACD